MLFDTLLKPLESPASGHRQEQLYQLLKAAILDGRLIAGTLLPPSRLLAADYHLARNTVLHAYQRLLAEGFLLANRRATRVAALPGKRASAGPRSAASEPTYPLLSQRAQRLPIRQGEPLLPFAPGLPDLNAFPWPLWARHLNQAWRAVSARQVAYAEAGGEPALRAAIAEFLSIRRGVDCAPEQVFIVPGGQIALDACARLLADSGDRVWLENPAYPTARSVFQTAGLDLRHIAVDAQGMAPTAEDWAAPPPRLVYLTPAHQYPLGSVLSLERRLALLNFVQASGGWIIEDDYDSEFSHAQAGSRPQPAIQGLQPDAPVIYLGTFSKLLYPGLRIAYMVLPRWTVDRLGAALASLYRSGQAVEQSALARFIESGHLTRHQRQMAPRYRHRQAVLRAALKHELGAEVTVLGGAAGLHLTVLLPAGPDDIQLVAALARHGLSARALSPYYAPGSLAPLNGLVLGYGMVDEGRIPELVGRLSIVLKASLAASQVGLRPA